nr:uncharacterized protein LOC109784411 [Aegilops tauschii subsp. strangulata]
MAPKKKSGHAAQPSTSKAPPPAASNVAGGAEAHEGADAAGEMVGAGGAITTSLAADAGVGGTGGEQHQQDHDGHAPQGTGEGVTPSAPLSPADGHSHNNGARTKANRRPPATPECGRRACTSSGTGRPSRRARRSRWPSSAFPTPRPGGGSAATMGAQYYRRRHRKELRNGTIDFINVHAKHYFGGHGTSSAAAEVSASGQADG